MKYYYTLYTIVLILLAGCKGQNKAYQLFNESEAYVQSKPVIHDNSVIVAAADVLYSYNKNTGVIRWQHNVNNCHNVASERVDDVIFYTSNYTKVVAYDTIKMKVIWSKEFEDLQFSKLTLFEDNIVFIDNRNIVVTMNAFNGEIVEKKKFGVGRDVRLYMLDSKENMFYVDYKNSLFSVYNRSKNTKSKGIPLNGRVYHSPICSDEYIYVTSHEGGIYKLNKKGDLIWSVPTGGRDLTSFAITSKGIVYAAEKNVVHIDDLTGKEQWRFVANGVIDVKPISYKDNVYSVDTDGRMYKINSSNGEGSVYSTFKSGLVDDTMTVDEGKAFIGTITGEFLSIDLE